MPTTTATSPTQIEVNDRTGIVRYRNIAVGIVQPDRFLGLHRATPATGSVRLFPTREDAIAHLVGQSLLPHEVPHAVPEAIFLDAGCRHVKHAPDAPPLHCALGCDATGRPLVTLQDTIGSCGDYRPAELRSIAAKLNAMAADAESNGSLVSHRRY